MTESKEKILARLYNDIANIPNEPKNSIDAIEFRRDQYGLTATEFAGLLGLTPSHYSEFKNGKSKLSLKNIKRAVAIGVPLTALV